MIIIIIIVIIIIIMIITCNWVDPDTPILTGCEDVLPWPETHIDDIDQIVFDNDDFDDLDDIDVDDDNNDDDNDNNDDNNDDNDNDNDAINLVEVWHEWKWSQ